MQASSNPEAVVHVDGARSRLISLAVASALLMEFVDATALSTALPTLARVFGSDPVTLKLALTSYLLALAVVAPASGWVADRFGGRRVFVAAMIVFLVGSAACGLSNSLGELVAARVLQGIGGAMMTPVARLIVVGSNPKARLVEAMSWFTTPALVGPLIGPAIAGFILSIASWRWIFFVNLPLGIAGLVAVARFVPPIRATKPGSFDKVGFVLCAVWISSVVLSADMLGASAFSTPMLLAIIAAGATAFGGFLLHARRRPRPVLDLGLLRYPTYRASIAGALLVRLGLGASPFLLPLLFQSALGMSPARAGALTVSTGVGALATRALLTRLLRWAGFRTVLIGTAAAVAILTAWPAAFQAGTPALAIVVVLFLAGAARALQFTAANTISYAEVPPAAVSSASTLSTVMQQIGMSLGVSLGGLLLHLSRKAGAPLQPGDFTIPFVGVGLVALGAVAVYWPLRADAGAEISGRPDHIRRGAPTEFAG